MEFLYASFHIEGTFLNPEEAIGNTPDTWAGDLNQNSSYTSRWAIGDPVDPLTDAALQTIRVRARKGSNTGVPTIALNLYEAGTFVRSLLTATDITLTGFQTLTVGFSSSDIVNRSDVEVEVIQAGASGNPSTRNCAQISSIEWMADTTEGAPPPEEREVVSQGQPGASVVFRNGSGDREAISTGISGNSTLSRVSEGLRQVSSTGLLGSSIVSGRISASRQITSTGLLGSSKASRFAIAEREVISQGQSGLSEVLREGLGDRIVFTKGQSGSSSARGDASASREVSSTGQTGQSVVARSGSGNRSITSSGVGGISEVDIWTADTRSVVSFGLTGFSQVDRSGFAVRSISSMGRKGDSRAQALDLSDFRDISITIGDPSAYDLSIAPASVDLTIDGAVIFAKHTIEDPVSQWAIAEPVIDRS